MNCYKERYRYIHFGLHERKEKTDVWFCSNNRSDDLIGIIRWHGPWRQYCFFPERNTVYSKGCMEDINDFIRQLMEQRQEARCT